MSLLVRIARLSDLPTIHNLIIDSFAAMNEFFDSDTSMTRKYVQQAVEGDLSAPNFESVYTKCPPNNFWVVEDSDSNKVYGCVALKKMNNHEAELVRMAVSPENRSRGYGSILIKSLISFAILQGFHRIILTTANPKSMTFYLKHDFVIAHQANVPLPNGGKVVSVFKMVKYLSEKVIESVAVVGGTHGNERIGVNLVNDWLGTKQKEIKRSTLTTKVIAGNPRAIEANTRFIDVDLNRQFAAPVVAADSNSRSNGDKTVMETTVPAVKYEETRAIELNKILGPKIKTFHYKTATIESSTSVDIVSKTSSATAGEPEVEFIIDLHSSESNVGIVLMISGEEDCLAYRVAYFVTNQIDRFKDVKITCSRGDKSMSYSVDSLAPSGLAIEVGPIKHGQCNNDSAGSDDAILLERTRDIVLTILTYFENTNLALLQAAKEHSSTSTSTTTVAISNNSNNNNNNSNNKVVTVDQARGLIHRTVFPTLSYFKQLGTIYFPPPPPNHILNNITTAGANTDNVDLIVKVVEEKQEFIYHPSFYSATHKHKDLTVMHVGDNVFQSIKTVITSGQQVQTPRKRHKDEGMNTANSNDEEEDSKDGNLTDAVHVTTEDIPLVLPENLLALLQSSGPRSGNGSDEAKNTEEQQQQQQQQEKYGVYPLFINEPAYASSRFAFSLLTLETKSIY